MYIVDSKGFEYIYYIATDTFERNLASCASARRNIQCKKKRTERRRDKKKRERELEVNSIL